MYWWENYILSFLATFWWWWTIVRRGVLSRSLPLEIFKFRSLKYPRVKGARAPLRMFYKLGQKWNIHRVIHNITRGAGEPLKGGGEGQCRAEAFRTGIYTTPQCCQEMLKIVRCKQGNFVSLSWFETCEMRITVKRILFLLYHIGGIDVGSHG